MLVSGTEVESAIIRRVAAKGDQAVGENVGKAWDRGQLARQRETALT